MNELIRLCEIWGCYIGAVGIIAMIAALSFLGGIVWGIIQIRYPYLVDAVKSWFCFC